MTVHDGPTDSSVLPNQVWPGLSPQHRARVVHFLATLAANLIASPPDANRTEVSHVHAPESLQDPPRPPGPPSHDLRPSVHHNTGA
jgi:hypothetical protein